MRVWPKAGPPERCFGVIQSDASSGAIRVESTLLWHLRLWGCTRSKHDVVSTKKAERSLFEIGHTGI